MTTYRVSNRKVTRAEFLQHKMAQEILAAFRFHNQIQTQLEVGNKETTIR